MLIVYKYPIPIAETFDIEMPENAKILSFQVQRDEPQIWALVDTSAKMRRRYFCLFGTGHPINIDRGLSFAGTCQTQGGLFVWHLFELLF